jgi:hypothetical protein
VRIHRMIPGTVYVAALSIAVAYGSPELHPGGESRDGDAQRISSMLTPGAIEYHLDPSNPAFTSGVSFDLGAQPRSVEAEIGDRSVGCRRLADDRWFCPAIAPVAGLESLRVTTGGAD